MLREVLKNLQKEGNVGRGRGAPWRRRVITMKEGKKGVRSLLLSRRGATLLGGLYVTWTKQYNRTLL